jgi:hypothetical protein
MANNDRISALHAFCERTRASDFNIVGMRSDCKNSHTDSPFKSRQGLIDTVYHFLFKNTMDTNSQKE